MVNSAEFAKRLSEILEYYGITATAFSDMLEVNRSTISHLLSGRNKPSLEFVLKVLNAFPEVELYWLLNGQGHFPTRTKNRPEDFSESGLQESDSILSKTDSISNQITVDFEQADQHKTKNNSFSQNPQGEDFGAIERIVVFYQNGKFKTYTP